MSEVRTRCSAARSLWLNRVVVEEHVHTDANERHGWVGGPDIADVLRLSPLALSCREAWRPSTAILAPLTYLASHPLQPPTQSRSPTRSTRLRSGPSWMLQQSALSVRGQQWSLQAAAPLSPAIRPSRQCWRLLTVAATTTSRLPCAHFPAFLLYRV